MAAIGSIVFCTACGNLLDESPGSQNTILTCEVCGTQNRDTSARKITMRSKPSAFPSALRTKRSAVQTLNEDDLQTTATINKNCPNCNAPEMRYQDRQTRSADEGSTIFYECTRCGHKYSENN